MERLVKIVFIISIICFSLIGNSWAIIMGLSIICACLGAFFSIYYISITIPIIYLLISFICHSHIGIIIGAIGVFVFRCIINDCCFNSKYHFPFFFSVIAFASNKYVPFLFPVPVILTIITLPVFPINVFRLKVKIVVVISIVFYFISALYVIYGYGSEKKRAYLYHGVWANPFPHYRLEKLTNTSCYSYSEFVQLLNADIISDLHNIDSYNELWVITPTKPFVKEELSTIKEWVMKGGNLIVSSDHTDLYGHARCANQIASIFGCTIHNSATFDVNNNQIFYDSFASPVIFKTGTNIDGLMFPIVSSWLWEENAYYANDNFFGPLSASGDDAFENVLLAGQISFGLGQVTFIQDSTIFANFAVYQPFVLNLADLASRHSFLARFFFLLPFLFAFCLWLFAMNYRHIFACFILFFPFLLPISDCPHFNYGEKPQIWSGNHNFVIENGCPYTNISTAYSQAALSKRKPLWISTISLSEKDVIWVDSIQPPCSQWRWVRVQDNHKNRYSSMSDWDSLYSYLETPFVRSWENIYNDYQKISVNALFSDNVMNDWWYNDGITENRYNRIKAWIAWLEKTTSPNNNQSIEYSKEKYNVIVRAKDKNAIFLKLPKPLEEINKEIYLGNGISGILFVHGDTLSIFGKKQYCDNINCPEVWTIDYVNNITER